MADWRLNERAQPFLAAIDAASTKHRLPSNLLGSLLQQESQFNPKAESPVGARGIAQIVPKWHPTAKPDDPQSSIDYAAGYLNRLYSRFGDWNKALAAYNWGQGNVSAAIRKHGDKWLDHAPEETRNYVTKLGPQAQATPEMVRSVPKHLLYPEREPLAEDPDVQAEYDIEAMEARIQSRVSAEQMEVRREIEVVRIEDELEARPKPDMGVTGYVGDVAAGINRGILGAADETAQFFGEILDYVGLDSVGEALKSVDLRGAAAEIGVGQTQTLAGDLSAGVAQFLTGFLPVNRAARSAAMTRGYIEGATQAAAAGALVDTIVFDPHEARFSNLIEEFPALKNPVTDFLAADENDSAAEGRLKNALEGLGLGVFVDGMIIAARGIKGVRRGRVNDEAADALITERKLADPEPEPKPDMEPDTPRADAENSPANSADSASNEADIPAAAQPKSFFHEEEFRSRMSLDPKLRDELAERIEAGDLNGAEDLIDFNANTVDWEKLEDPDQVRALINTTSEVLADFIDDAKGGVQTLAQSRKLANLVGGSAEQVAKLYADVRGGRGITARLFAAQRVLTASADRLRVLAQKAAASGATQADELAFLRQVELHGMVQAQIKGTGTEVARALHAMRALKAASEDSFREFDEIIQGIGGGDPARRKMLANEIAKLRDENGINKIVRRSRFQRVNDVVTEMYVNGLLSAISTQTLNNVSNAIKVIEGITENFTASAIGKVRTLRGGANPERIRLKEAQARMAGTMVGMRRATGISWESLRRLDMDELAKDFKESPTARAWVEEKPQLDTRQRVDADTRKAIAAAGEGLDARAWNAFGKFIRLPSRMIMTSDEFFKNVNYQQELAAIAYRKASDAADARGLTGAKREKAMQRDIMALLNDPPDDVHFAALDHARYQTFQADLEGNLSRWMESGLHKVPALRFIVPFFRTPVNIVKQAVLERSPFALASRKFWQTVAKGGPEGDIALARLVTGSTAMTAAMFAVLDGNLTGSGLNNGSRRNTEALDGVPPYSIRIGDTWYQYNRLEPMGLIMGLSADLVDLMSQYGEEQYDEIAEMAAGALTAVTTNITDKTWFKGIADLVQVLEDPKRYAPKWVKDLSTTVITPYSSLLRRTASDFDTTAREAWTWMDTYKSKLPGFSRTLPPKHDLLGNPVVRTDYLGPAILSPFAVGKEKDDPVYSELARLELFYDNPERDVFGIGEDVDSATYSEFMRIRGQERAGGRTLQEALGYLFETNAYREQLTDVGRREMVQRLIQRYTRAARGRMLRDDPDLLNKVRESKIADLEDRLQ